MTDGMSGQMDTQLETTAGAASGAAATGAAAGANQPPIAQAAESAFLPVAGIFEVVLVLLFVVLLPILRRVTRRIQRQMEEIEYRALYDELDYQRGVQAYVWATSLVNSVGLQRAFEAVGLDTAAPAMMVFDRPSVT